MGESDAQGPQLVWPSCLSLIVSELAFVGAVEEAEGPETASPFAAPLKRPTLGTFLFFVLLWYTL